MLAAIEHRGPDGAGVFIGDKIVKAEKLEKLEFKKLKGNLGIGHVRLKIVGTQADIQPFLDCKYSLILVHNGEIYNYQELKKELKNHKLETDADSEVIVHLIEQNFNGNLIDAVKKSLPKLDGDYAFAVTDGKTIVIARDPIGIKPVYLGENKQLFAFASERKALWSIGIKETWALKPRNLAILTIGGISVQEGFIFPKPPITKILETKAIEKLSQIFRKAIEKRVQNLEKVGIIFSGGIDSSLVAKFASDSEVKVTLYTSGMAGSEDLIHAEKVAGDLGLSIKLNELDLDKFKPLIPKTLYAIEEISPIQVGIALPIYAAATLAHSDGQKVILTGQGADELFGGYYRYHKILEDKGDKELEALFWTDLCNIYQINLQRDDATMMANSLELRIPFLDLAVVNFALSLPIELKIRTENGFQSKYILRKLGDKVGLPKYVVTRPKRAIQYGARTQKALKRVAKKSGFNKYLPKKVSFSGDFISLYLNILAYQLGIPIPNEIQKIVKTLGEMK